MRPRARRVPIEPVARPMVVAHRGASGDVAEHTLAAYIHAIEGGADALECDVRMTRDGHLVCVHDRTVNRTSDGRGVVSEFDLATLNELNFSSWHVALPESADELLNHRPYLAEVEPDRIAVEGGVLTLDHLLGLVRDSSRPVRLLVETKHPSRYQGLVEKELIEQLARYGWAGRPGPPDSLHEPADPDSRVVVMSFAPTALRRVKLLAPDVPTVLLIEWRLPVLRDAVLPAGVPIVGPSVELLRADPDFVARAHRRGHPVYAWTVDEPADIDFVLGLGVDTVITNRPGSVIARLSSA